jgi:hypothetical protein
MFPLVQRTSLAQGFVRVHRKIRESAIEPIFLTDTESSVFGPDLNRDLFLTAGGRGI